MSPLQRAAYDAELDEKRLEIGRVRTANLRRENKIELGKAVSLLRAAGVPTVDVVARRFEGRKVRDGDSAQGWILQEYEGGYESLPSVTTLLEDGRFLLSEWATVERARRGRTVVHLRPTEDGRIGGGETVLSPKDWRLVVSFLADHGITIAGHWEP